MKTIFMFSGQGSQYYQMGRKLFEGSRLFREHLRRMDEIVRSIQGTSIIESLYDPAHRLSDAFVSLRQTHPAIFMCGYALAKMLMEEGIVPDYVLGCSLGEFTAAVVAGMLDETEALRLIIRQAELIETHCREGRMVALLQGIDTYYANPVISSGSTIAAVYGPAQIVIAGEKEPLNEVKQFLKGKDFLHQELMVAYGFHSAAIDPAAESFLSCLPHQRFKPASLPVLSGMTGLPLHAMPEKYFWEVVRKRILFSEAIQQVEQLEEGEQPLLYIDLGASGSLANQIKYSVKDEARSKGFQVMSPFSQEMKKLEEVRRFHQAHKKQPAVQKPTGSERLLAYIFPGQGSQKRGMGEDLFDRFPEQVSRASEILGYSVKDLCMRDAENKLNKTAYTQPALYVVNALSYLRSRAEDGSVPDVVLGHSLGEYNALFAAGAIDFETGLRLVKKRGALMAQIKGGGMAAVKGLSIREIYNLIERYGLEELDIANYNTPNQVVLSGPLQLIENSRSIFEAAGATLYFQLNVSGAFHSRCMQPAREEFERFLEPFEFLPLQIPVVSNVEARFYEPGKIKDLLALQLVKPVRWTDSIAFLLKKGDVSFKEIGPGDVLTKLVLSIQANAIKVQTELT